MIKDDSKDILMLQNISIYKYMLFFFYFYSSKPTKKVHSFQKNKKQH